MSKPALSFILPFGDGVYVLRHGHLPADLPRFTVRIQAQLVGHCTAIDGLYCPRNANGTARAEIFLGPLLLS